MLLFNLHIFVLLAFSRESDLLQVINLISAFFMQVELACAENFINGKLLVLSRFLIRRVFKIVDVIFVILISVFIIIQTLVKTHGLVTLRRIRIVDNLPFINEGLLFFLGCDLHLLGLNIEACSGMCMHKLDRGPFGCCIDVSRISEKRAALLLRGVLGCRGR